MKRSLDGLCVLVTGASSGIGAALAEQLAAGGARLALAARRLERLKELNARLGGKHQVLIADVADAEACRTLVADAHAALGRLDAVVCNAGYGATQLSWKQTPEDVRRMFATNVHGTHDVVYHAVPLMLSQPPRDGWRGQLVFVSSAAARRGIPFLGPYAATKAAQLSMAEALRVELAEDQIAVTSVHPAGTATEFGDVAEREGGVAITNFGGRGGNQTAAQVAKAMVRGIVRPTPEVWPARGYRQVLALNALAPRFGDAAMRRLKRSVDDADPS